jgi:hypothetical protein
MLRVVLVGDRARNRELVDRRHVGLDQRWDRLDVLERIGAIPIARRRGRAGAVIALAAQQLDDGGVANLSQQLRYHRGAANGHPREPRRTGNRNRVRLGVRPLGRHADRT